MSDQIEIVPYDRKYKSKLKEINLPWVENLFSVEPIDQKQFDYPEETIIEPGGAILFAKLNEEIVGSVALNKVNSEEYEMIKMGVKPEARGKGIGHVLAKAVISKAREMGGKKLVLYSSSKLDAARALYSKHGFISVVPEEGKYCRCDYKMELKLS